jgi:hypothetical protein
MASFMGRITVHLTAAGAAERRDLAERRGEQEKRKG